MPDDLGLSLNRGNTPESRGPVLIVVLLVVAILLSGANLVTKLAGWNTGSDAPSGLSGGKLEELSLKLEGQQLHAAAARSWIDYLLVARPDTRESAGIWYRIGRLYQENGDYERSLDAYYRSETIFTLKDIQPEISLRVSECLERLGHFAALRRELERRTAFEPGGEPGGEIVAEIGNWKISQIMLETMIEAEVDAQLARAAGGFPPEEIRARKEKLLGDLLGEGERQKWLERFIVEELIYRIAMEDKIYETASYRELVRDLEKKLIVQKRMENEYAARITVTDEEMRAWYEKNTDMFRKDGVTKGFEESAGQVHASVRLEKEMQVQSMFIRELMEKYDVVIHHAAPADGRE